MRRLFSAFVFSFMMLTLFSCSKQADEITLKKRELKIGFIFPGPVDADGYNKLLYSSRNELDLAGFRTFYIEDVPPNERCYKAIESLINLGCSIIYSTSEGYLSYVEKMAEIYPNVKFATTSGKPNGKNLSVYNGRTYEGMYLSGIAAGLKTKTNRIAYIASFPLSECIRDIDAFALGVQSVNPDATIDVEWTFRWNSSTIDKIRTADLIKKGCDVIATHTDSKAAGETVKEYRAFFIPSNFYKKDVSKQIYLTSPIIKWSVFYLDDTKKFLDGTWESRFYWSGLKEGMVRLEPLGPECMPGTSKKIQEAKTNIEKDKNYIFKGPIYDQFGSLRVKEGESLTDDEIWNINWFVSGIRGYIPKSN